MLSQSRFGLPFLLLLAACSGEKSRATDGAATRVLTIATPADADALIPQLVQSTQGKQVTDLLFDHLARPNSSLETAGDAGFKPELAQSWQWSNDSLSIAFAINPSARWHDGKPVTARDVKFSLDLYRDPSVASPHASNFEGIDSISVRDSLTAVVWWKARHAEQFFQIAFNLSIVPEHLLQPVARAALASSEFAAHPIGSGRYRFEKWTREQQLMIVTDSANYRGNPTFERVVWVVTSDPTAASLSVLAGQADILESVRGDAFVKARQSSTVRTFEYGSLDYAFMLFNFDRTLYSEKRFFNNRAVRVALSEALDRQAMVVNALDSLGAVALGPFSRATSGSDTAVAQIAHNVASARKTLDSLGWVLDPKDNLRKKNGKAFKFELLVPASSATRQKYAVLIQAQLAAIGVGVDIVPLEPGIFANRLEKGEFDAALNMWRSDPSPVVSLRQVWGSHGPKAIGANYSRYSNAAFDATLDSAQHSFSTTERRSLYKRAYQLIVSDAAAIWLYEPRNFAAINSRVSPSGMRADAWWAELSDWNASGSKVASKP